MTIVAILSPANSTIHSHPKKPMVTKTNIVKVMVMVILVNMLVKMMAKMMLKMVMVMMMKVMKQMVMNGKTAALTTKCWQALPRPPTPSTSC